MTNGSTQAPNYGAKDLGKYQDLGRGPFTSYFRRLAGAVGYAPTLEPLPGLRLLQVAPQIGQHGPDM